MRLQLIEFPKLVFLFIGLGSPLILPRLAFAFPAAIQSKHGIDLHGNNLKVDSYDSSDPAKSTGALYDPLKAGDAGEVASSGGITNSLPTGNASIYGHLYTASSSPNVLGANGGVGTHAWLATNYGVEPGYELTNFSFAFPDTAAPYSNGLAPTGGVIVNTSGATNLYDHILYSGDYVATDLPGTAIVLGAARLVLTSGLHMGVQDSITIAPGARLVLYSAGTNCVIGGNGVYNQNGLAGAFILYCSPSVTNLMVNASLIGILSAPYADASLNGSGTTTVDVSGSLMVQSLILNGNFNVHLDESLTLAAALRGSVGPSDVQFQFDIASLPGFSYVVLGSTNLTSWEALVTNVSPFTFVETNRARWSRRFYRTLYSP